MNPFTKNAVIAGLVALVVALGVVFGARAISPSDNNSGVSLKVTAPDGSVIGTTEPVRVSSGPPVPACSTVGTKLNCQGPGLPFDWVAVGFGDSGANEAFGAIIPGSYNLDAGLQIFAKATITPQATGDLSLTGSLTVPVAADSGINCPNGSTFIVALCSIHGDAATQIWSTGGLIACTGPVLNDAASAAWVNPSTIFGGVGGTVSGLEAGVAYDCMLSLVPGANGVTYQIPDGSTGGIWIHESL